MKLLEGLRVSKFFKGVVALKEVDFTVQEKEILGLIGPNGAGKTTLFNVISGFYRPDSGTIRYQGNDITNVSPWKARKLGIARTFQMVRPLPNISVIKNVMLPGIFGSKTKRNTSEVYSEATHLLELVGLKGKENMLAGRLIMADRRRLEVARALSAFPKIVLLDEVLAGLNPVEVADMVKLLSSIRDEMGVSFFWAEHVVKAVMEIADRVIVLHHGEKIAEGKPHQIASDKKVIDAYLGESYA
jgi:branched-chain amino acid transport system ATP-binding protein